MVRSYDGFVGCQRGVSCWLVGYVGVVLTYAQDNALMDSKGKINDLGAQYIGSEGPQLASGSGSADGPMASSTGGALPPLSTGNGADHILVSGAFMRGVTMAAAVLVMVLMI